MVERKGYESVDLSKEWTTTVRRREGEGRRQGSVDLLPPCDRDRLDGVGGGGDRTTETTGGNVYRNRSLRPLGGGDRWCLHPTDGRTERSSLSTTTRVRGDPGSRGTEDSRTPRSEMGRGGHRRTRNQQTYGRGRILVTRRLPPRCPGTGVDL